MVTRLIRLLAKLATNSMKFRCANALKGFGHKKQYASEVELCRKSITVPGTKSKNQTNLALIVSGGKGMRCYENSPKQYIEILGTPVIVMTLQYFIDNINIDAIQVIIAEEHLSIYLSIMKRYNLLYHKKILPIIFGGDTRQESVSIGLKAVKDYRFQNVLIHDAVRPFVSQRIINDVIQALESGEAAVDVCIPVTDTIKYQTYKRMPEGYHTQTPQGFKYNLIEELHDRFKDINFSDDISLCMRANIRHYVVIGDKNNIKITYKEDFKYAQLYYRGIMNFLPRVGIGFDVHAFDMQEHNHENYVMLCGVKLKNLYSIKAHSDGDVALHALTDAMLGAMGAGSIGSLFPNNDPQWKGVNSVMFVEYASNIINSAQGIINNIDITIICERPKIMPFSEQMKGNISRILRIESDRINIKAVTPEGLSIIGPKDGIAVYAACTILLPN